ncbi:hypothetical protein ASPCAL05768 [Aspergillus calidoustus]|jgi:hypothetical protein|uniref:Uncharacterized protein n=1 Tax=Aspergillus calidoustus TaxID=454130 RepID=A0A0U5FYL1_ASPCI|nr:hypothetical protein ASPCAL05768 [Aspergillus calidoustus]
MRNKPRISITLHPRGKNSLGENRRRLHYAAYHWGILISPKNFKSNDGEHTHFDVTDSLFVHAATGEASDDWRFRERTSRDPDVEFQILVKVLVGKLDTQSVTVKEVERRLREVYLPRNGGDMGKNCVSWTKEAVGVLVKMGVLGGFDVQKVMDEALEFADCCLREQKGLGNVVDHIEKRK